MVIDDVSSLPNVLILDDDRQIIKLMKLHTKGKANIIPARTIKEAWDELERNKVHIVISDQNLEGGEYGSEFLRDIRVQHPEIRRIIVTSDNSIDVAVTSVNEASIQGYILKPWKKDKLLSIINEQYMHYLKQEREKEELKTLRHSSRQFRQKLLEQNASLAKSLKSFDPAFKGEDLFINFSGIIQNYISILEDQIKEFCLSVEKRKSDEIESTISEIVMFANQYNQEKVFLLVQMIRGYIRMIFGDYQKVNQIVIELQIRSVLRPKARINDDLMHHINEFIQLFTYMKNDVPVQEAEKEIFSRLEALVKFPVDNLLTFTAELAEILKAESISFDYFFVIKNDTTVFSYRSAGLPGINPTLIGNFIQALEELFETILNSNGKLESVTHEDGSLIFWRSGSIYYVFLTRERSYYHRIALRKIGEETIQFVEELPDGEASNERVEFEIKQRLQEFFTL